MKQIDKLIGLALALVFCVPCLAGDVPAKPTAEQTVQLFTYDRLYSDENGNSHWDKVTVDFKQFPYANDVPPVWVQANAKYPAVSTGFMAAPTGWDGRANHPPRTRQFFIVLTGAVAFTASDGETKIFHPGQIVLMDDHKGKGHGSFNAGQGVAQVMSVVLPD
ncbi:MAG: cupin domain-containing protein [Azonexus sp.]|jgi:mannose-6-phosphate isomerase-like protein (cupin superfamily)|nr:cupin domain-containing protein [Azonexus sp.]